MLALLRPFSLQELRHHPWRTAAAVLSVLLGVALAYSVHLINASALSEFAGAVRSVNGQPDLELRAVQMSFDESLFERIGADPAVAIASPVLELSTLWTLDEGLQLQNAGPGKALFFNQHHEFAVGRCCIVNGENCPVVFRPLAACAQIENLARAAQLTWHFYGHVLAIGGNGCGESSEVNHSQIGRNFRSGFGPDGCNGAQQQKHAPEQ